MLLNFKTKISKNDISLLKGVKCSSTPLADISLSWSARITSDSQKISDIAASVPDQEIEFLVEVEKGDEFVEESLTLKLSEVKVEYVREETSDSRALGLMPVEIIFISGEWTVKFAAYSV